MTIVEKIENDLKEAMREKNAAVVRTLRTAMSSIKYVEKRDQGAPGNH